MRRPGLGDLLLQALSWHFLALGGFLNTGHGQDQPGLARDSDGNGSKSKQHLGRGYELLKDGRLNEAAREFQSALDLNPGLDRARFQLAVCRFALGEREASRREFTQLLAATGGDPSVVYYLGRLDLLEENIDSSLRYLEDAAREPPFPDTAYYLALAYFKKGNFAMTQKWLSEARKTIPLEPRVPDQLVRLYQKTGRRAEAEKAGALATELRKRTYEHTELAVACTRALETRSAQEARETCRKLLDPQDPTKLVNLGIIYGRFGHYEEALEPLRRAFYLDPESYEIHHNLGLTYYQLKRFGEARVALEQAVELRGDFFGSNALLGATLVALGEDWSAYKVLNHAYELNPAHRETAALLARVAMTLAERTRGEKNYPDCLAYLRRAATLRPEDLEIRRQVREVSTMLEKQSKAH